jgi:hypothetical protein
VISELCRHGPNFKSNPGADTAIVATFLVKEMLYKEHLDIFRGPHSHTSVPDIIRRSLQQFGMTHESQDIEDLNRLLTVRTSQFSTILAPSPSSLLASYAFHSQDYSFQSCYSFFSI